MARWRSPLVQREPSPEPVALRYAHLVAPAAVQGRLRQVAVVRGHQVELAQPLEVPLAAVLAHGIRGRVHLHAPWKLALEPARAWRRPAAMILRLCSLPLDTATITRIDRGQVVAGAPSAIRQQLPVVKQLALAEPGEYCDNEYIGKAAAIPSRAAAALCSSSSSPECTPTASAST
eukprot:CAMPEP_0118814118 /NCGR_PEP_ID=MMETSP1162-20130426/3377_1 /TAXON_ID=33656 /ORGANISM="Phaeocystis Sp, Strain CCMP2710" /LENGTH=175 /DNA_ID=CAMNT_0006743983 /DNA_START=279 /DNA_END=807 /DNA_ORIENTATION=-